MTDEEGFVSCDACGVMLGFAYPNDLCEEHRDPVLPGPPCYWCGADIDPSVEYCPLCNTKRQDLPLP